ncbi:MAG TPA: nuclease-related domain-containing protein, partial [Mycobacterium sp.]|nr:nuclease-related domain-containing protein [Mycobacterium sp.]
TAFCLPCAGFTAAPQADASSVATTTASVAPAEVASVRFERPTSVAGGSAQAEFERRHAKRDARLVAKWGRFAGIAKFLSDDPHTTKAWAVGAEGERRLAARLESILGDRAVLLHDRKIGRANIDHVVIASSGIWVIDAKSYAGLVEYRNVGRWLGPPDHRIYVGGRDKTKLAAGMEWQVTAVRKALGGHGASIHPVLCFVNNNWSRRQNHFAHDGVLVVWGAKLAELIAEPGDVQPEQVEAIARRLSAKLKPAT